MDDNLPPPTALPSFHDPPPPRLSFSSSSRRSPSLRTTDTADTDLKQTLITYDDRMNVSSISSTSSPSSFSPFDSPQRTQAILQRLLASDIIPLCSCLSTLPPISQDTLQLSHTVSHIQSVLSQPTVSLSASLAVSSVVELVSRIFQSESEPQTGFAIARPPGHHASSNSASGFCFFNNVAIGAKFAIERLKKRVAVVDWDVHHGNGTEEILHNVPGCLLLGCHRFGNGIFPGTGDRNSSNRVINVPFPRPFGSREILQCFLHIFLPALIQFQPDIILVSAGFDAAEGDQFGQCHVQPSTYYRLTRLLLSVTPRVVMSLEGGYEPEITAECVVFCLRALVGVNSGTEESEARTHRGSDRNLRTIRHVIDAQSRRWELMLRGEGENRNAERRKRKRGAKSFDGEGSATEQEESSRKRRRLE